MMWLMWSGESRFLPSQHLFFRLQNVSLVSLFFLFYNLVSLFYFSQNEWVDIR